MSKSIWMIICMASICTLALSMGMVMSLGQLQEVPAADWVKLAEATTNEFKLENVSVRVSLKEKPTAMRLSYLTKQDSKFNLSAQNEEMEKIAQFAMMNYKGKDLWQIEQFLITRSETHGSGCFQQTYVANHTLVNIRRNPPPGRLGPRYPVHPPPPPPQPQER